MEDNLESRPRHKMIFGNLKNFLSMMYKSVHFPQEMTRGVTAFIAFHILDNSPYHLFILILHNVILFIPRVTRNCEWGFQSKTHQKYCVRCT